CIDSLFLHKPAKNPTEPGVHSHYLGGYEHKMWQAVRASSAAMGHDLHQVRPGPALAIHECKCLWTNTSVQCVVSLGTGRVETAGKNNTTYTSLKNKLPNVITSATDTEEVHVMLDALLSPDLCLRFNPYMNENITLDESRGEKLKCCRPRASTTWTGNWRSCRNLPGYSPGTRAPSKSWKPELNSNMACTMVCPSSTASCRWVWADA
uniref:Uncharacterized protein n=1 Tax=Oncorhynchus tshawytscha TaxID=74940 RepID=A0A8C8JVC3_ONCTS